MVVKEVSHQDSHPSAMLFLQSLILEEGKKIQIDTILFPSEKYTFRDFNF